MRNECKYSTHLIIKAERKPDSVGQSLIIYGKKSSKMKTSFCTFTSEDLQIIAIYRYIIMTLL